MSLIGRLCYITQGELMLYDHVPCDNVYTGVWLSDTDVGFITLPVAMMKRTHFVPTRSNVSNFYYVVLSSASGWIEDIFLKQIT